MPRAWMGLILPALLPAIAGAATYRGHSIDGPRYVASITNEDIGTIRNVEVKFSGHNVTVYLRRSYQIYLVLQDEVITDPRHIMARDDRRGIDWEIDVHNLREATEGGKR